MGAKVDATKLSSMEIAQIFSDYVGRMEDWERHTKAACKEVDSFDVCCSSEFPDNVRVQNVMYEKMMNVAIEFEESGFIAGFKTAMALMTGDDGLLPMPAGIENREEAGKAQKQVLPAPPYNSSPKEETIPHAAVTKPQCENHCQNDPEKYIDTTQIAKILGRTNWKTVRTINNSLIPFLSDEEKRDFIQGTKRDRHKKEQIIYKLTLEGCRKFIEMCESEQFRMYANFVKGAEILRQEVEKVWCSECGCHIA